MTADIVFEDVLMDFCCDDWRLLLLASEGVLPVVFVQEVGDDWVMNPRRVVAHNVILSGEHVRKRTTTTTSNEVTLLLSTFSCKGRAEAAFTRLCDRVERSTDQTSCQRVVGVSERLEGRSQVSAVRVTDSHSETALIGIVEQEVLLLEGVSSLLRPVASVRVGGQARLLLDSLAHLTIHVVKLRDLSEESAL